ncbi:uncharacterized protein LOC114329089 [Diabrotica virgifera virgifera]|uniref:Uncharacterized protein LOC114329089 n=1 Tax=Diabrotica virgifera virgifera TaxID=50390 RepID=A0A6P7FG62_DIAVI|nr:uncharacterized protein LOC114329089 [Diabrotica virgifera virgifera]
MATFIVDSKLSCDQMREEFWNMQMLAVPFKNVYDGLVWCASRNLINNSVLCDMCNRAKTFIRRTGVVDQYCWKCKECSATTSVRDGSFFARSSLSIYQIIILMYGFANDFPQKLIRREVSLGNCTKTATRWCLNCRQVCTRYFEQHPVELGGFDEQGEPLVVELDESSFLPRKNLRGADKKEEWVFGGLERKTGKLFLTPVQERKEETLLPLISGTILPGTVIVTNGLEAYRNIGRFGGGVYEHQIILKQNNFRNSDDNTVHTKNMEKLWLRAKKRLSTQWLNSTDLFPSYLQEFMWREQVKHKDPFVEFLICVSEQYLVS